MTHIKTLIRASAILAALLGAQAAAAATSGTFIGVGNDQNDPFDNPGVLTQDDIANYVGDPFSTPALYKCDEIDRDAVCDDVNGSNGIYGDYTDAFTITFDTTKPGEPGEFIGGTWTYNPTGDETLAPSVIVLKTGDGFAAWNISGLTSGDWDVTDPAWGSDKAISHISFYDTEIDPIPLPAAGWLLIAGVGGLAALRRRRG